MNGKKIPWALIVCILVLLAILFIVLFANENEHAHAAKQKNPNKNSKKRNVNEIWPTYWDLIRDCDLLGDSQHTCFQFDQEHQFYSLQYDSSFHSCLFVLLFLYATSTQPHVTLIMNDELHNKDTWYESIHQQCLSITHDVDLDHDKNEWIFETQARFQPKHWTTLIKEILDEYLKSHMCDYFLKSPLANVKSWYEISADKWQEIKLLTIQDMASPVYTVDTIPKIYHAWFLKAHFQDQIDIQVSGSHGPFLRVLHLYKMFTKQMDHMDNKY